MTVKEATRCLCTEAMGCGAALDSAIAAGFIGARASLAARPPKEEPSMFWKRRKAPPAKGELLEKMKKAVNALIDGALEAHVSPLAIADALEKRAETIRRTVAVTKAI